MDSQTARDWLNDARDRKPSALGEAVDVLYQEFHGYDAIAKQVPFSKERLSQLHKVFLLPKGIRWQIDERRIRLGHAEQIARLQEEDQWLLAFTIVQKGISVKDCTEVVRAVVRTKRPLRDVLHEMIGIRYDEAFPALLAGITLEDGFRISRAAWNKELNWADFSLAAIEEATRVDLERVAETLEGLAAQLRSKRAQESGDGALDP